MLILPVLIFRVFGYIFNVNLIWFILYDISIMGINDSKEIVWSVCYLYFGTIRNVSADIFGYLQAIACAMLIWLTQRIVREYNICVGVAVHKCLLAFDQRFRVFRHSARSYGTWSGASSLLYIPLFAVKILFC